jgi:hypothetical protein
MQAPDGSYQRLYSVACPESWVEDFGNGQVVGGVAQVPLEPAFATLLRGGDYQVFLTDYADSHGLYVSSRAPAGFEVRERLGGASTVPFGYRVLAKRRDTVTPRLELVSLPAAHPVKTPARPEVRPLPKLSEVPKVPEPPELPQLPERQIP